MLWESWQYLRTPVKFPYIRKMGYLTEAIAMVARAKRCQQPWGNHYQHCQQAILEAAQKARYHRTALIFGAGTLRDIPLKALSDQFEKVLLVDLVFLPAARKQVSRFENIELIEHDITESLAGLFQGDLTVVTPDRWQEADAGRSDIDLVVSLNLITQLPLIPVRWLMKHFQLTEEQADQLGQKLMHSHMNYLQNFDTTVCLIADREGIQYDVSGQECDRFDPWWEVEQPHPASLWDWEVIPLKESKTQKCQINRVAVSYL